MGRKPGWGARLAAIGAGLLGAVVLASLVDGDGSPPPPQPAATATVASSPPLPKGPRREVNRPQWSPELYDYAERADQICLSSAWLADRETEEAKQIGLAHHLSYREREGAQILAYAHGMSSQYKRLKKLGPAPQFAGVMREWVKTSRERAMLQRRRARAWLYGHGKDRALAYSKLSAAKERADIIAQRLPFHICGTPEGPPQKFTLAELREDPPRLYVGRRPVKDRSLVHVGTKVYWGPHSSGHVAGKVIDVVRGMSEVVFQYRLYQRYARPAIRARAQLGYTQNTDTGERIGWITITPPSAKDTAQPAVTELTAVR